MEPAVDPYHPLIRLVDRYKSDVHLLRPAATVDAIEEAEQRLRFRLPSDLRQMLERWNGAVLFRGVLRVRSTTELTPVSQDHPDIILFADGPRDGEHWAMAPVPSGHVFGTWREGELEASYSSFHRWLMGTIRLLDESPKGAEQRDALLLDCDPSNAFLLLRKATGLLAEGNPEQAAPLLRQATASDPDLLPAWQRLGDVLISTDQAQARWAYVKALRAVRLPLPYPGAPGADPDLVISLEKLFRRDDPAWERELDNLLQQRISDVKTPRDIALVEVVVLAWARILASRGERRELRDGLVKFLNRAEAFSCPADMVRVRLLLCSLETELGLHDDAESRLRPLHESPVTAVRARARLALGRIILVRQEPWGEEVLEEALAMLEEDNLKAQALLYLVEWHLLHDRMDKAGSALQAAAELLFRTGDEHLLMSAAQLRGDLVKRNGDPEAAREAWREAHKRCKGLHDHEMALRLALRGGDLALEEGDGDEALKAWSHAAEGFAKQNRPIREAWARLRLSRLGCNESARRALKLFKDADLAAGVAAVDAVSGDPAASLAWHRSRAADHARLRAEAQRRRPPLGRADADRPERRLGAHQLAIAACGVEVVRALQADMLEQARELESASSLSVDPRLAGYMATVDLLAHHRSYEAATALLGHLSTGYISGAPGRALKAALTRSTNAALVDGLLSILERESNPVLVARAAEILGWRRERAAADCLRRLLVTGGSAQGARRASVVALGRIGCKESADEILEVLQTPELAEAAAIALLLLGDRRGVDYHAQVLTRGDTTQGGSPGEIVGRYGDPTYMLILRATTARSETLAAGAIHGLGYLGDLRAVETLIDAIGRPEPRVGALAAAALEVMLGHQEPPDAPDLRQLWKRYWEQAQKDLTPGLRYRFGAPLDPGVLVRQLSHDDIRIRRAAYDELVITTGVNLPLDVDGAWRVQVHHREGWEAWWNENRESFPSGRWLFHGETVG